jgi:hypothetical protein
LEILFNITLLQNQEPDVLASIPPSNGYTSEDGEDGGDMAGGLQMEELVYWAPFLPPTGTPQRMERMEAM